MTPEEFTEYWQRVSKLPSINLWGMNNIGVILDYPSGIAYHNHVGGYACDQLFREGLFTSISGHDCDQKNYTRKQDEYWQHEELKEFFTGPKWKGWCTDGIDKETADFVDNILHRQYGNSKYFSVDRNMFEYSKEAWIFVKLNLPDKQYFIDNIDVKTRVLTWLNSD